MTQSKKCVNNARNYIMIFSDKPEHTRSGRLLKSKIYKQMLDDQILLKRQLNIQACKMTRRAKTRHDNPSEEFLKEAPLRSFQTRRRKMNKVANSLNLPLIVDRNVSINGVSTFIAVEDNKNVAVDMDSDQDISMFIDQKDVANPQLSGQFAASQLRQKMESLDSNKLNLNLKKRLKPLTNPKEKFATINRYQSQSAVNSSEYSARCSRIILDLQELKVKAQGKQIKHKNKKYTGKKFEQAVDNYNSSDSVQSNIRKHDFGSTKPQQIMRTNQAEDIFSTKHIDQKTSMKIASVYKVINRLGHNSNKQETLIPVEIQYTDQYASRVVPKQKIERKKQQIYQQKDKVNPKIQTATIVQSPLTSKDLLKQRSIIEQLRKAKVRGQGLYHRLKSLRFGSKSKQSN